MADTTTSRIGGDGRPNMTTPGVLGQIPAPLPEATAPGPAASGNPLTGQPDRIAVEGRGPTESRISRS
jgi:hypothetical protein